MSEQPSIDPLREWIKGAFLDSKGEASVKEAIAAYDNKCAELETADLTIKGIEGNLAHLEKENEQFEAQVAALTKERDEACAACAAWSRVCYYRPHPRTYWDGTMNEKAEDDYEAAMKATEGPNPGQPLLDRIHALEQGVKVAVEALDSICSQDYLTSGDPNDHPVAIASDALGNLKHLTPLLTTPTKCETT